MQSNRLPSEIYDFGTDGVSEHRTRAREPLSSIVLGKAGVMNLQLVNLIVAVTSLSRRSTSESERLRGKIGRGLNSLGLIAEPYDLNHV